MIVRSEFRDLDTPTGPMRTQSTRRPSDRRQEESRALLYPEIFQQTPPIARLSSSSPATDTS